MAIPTILIFFVMLPIVLLAIGGSATGFGGVMMLAFFTLIGFGSLYGMLGLIQGEENRTESA